MDNYMYVGWWSASASTSKWISDVTKFSASIEALCLTFLQIRHISTHLISCDIMIISRMVDSLWLSNEVSAEQQFNGVLSILTTTQVAQVGRFLSCLSTSLFAFIVSFALLRLQNLFSVGIPEGFLWGVSTESGNFVYDFYIGNCCGLYYRWSVQ